MTQDLAIDPGLVPSKQFDVWTRLYSRYLLEPAPAAGFGVAVAKSIVPVTQADDLLKQNRGEAGSTNIIGTGNATVFTVPSGFRQKFYTFHFSLSTGTWTISRIVLRDVSEGTDVFIHEEGSVTTINERFSGLLLDEGDQVQVFVNTHSVDGFVTWNMWTEREEAF